MVVEQVQMGLGFDLGIEDGRVTISFQVPDLDLAAGKMTLCFTPEQAVDVSRRLLRLARACESHDPRTCPECTRPQ